MRKYLSIFMLIFMLVGITGCSSSEIDNSTELTNTSTEVSADTPSDSSTVMLDGSWPEERVKIGFITFDTTDEQFLAIQEYYDYLAEYFNFEVMYSESIQSAEDELKFIENCASAGCQAIIGYYNVSEGEAVQLTIDKGMYYWGGADKAGIYDRFVDNEYYLGGYDGGDSNYLVGYSVAEALIDQGCEKLVYTSGGRDFGIDFFIQRSEGFYDAVAAAQKENPNIEVVYDVSGWPGTDSFTADQMRVCDMDIDGIGNSFSALVWVQPLSSVGKFEEVKLATVGSIDESYKNLMEVGSVVGIMYENEEVHFGGAIPAILNAVTGDGDVNRNEGKAMNYYAPKWIVSNADEFNTIYEKYDDGEYYITAEEVAQCIKAFNPSASYQSFEDTYSSKTIDIIYK